MLLIGSSETHRIEADQMYRRRFVKKTPPGAVPCCMTYAMYRLPWVQEHLRCPEFWRFRDSLAAGRTMPCCMPWVPMFFVAEQALLTLCTTSLSRSRALPVGLGVCLWLHILRDPAVVSTESQALTHHIRRRAHPLTGRP